MKKTKKNLDKFMYPHPIIKSFKSVPQQQQGIPPYAYQNFHCSNSNTVPQKLVRSTHLEPLLSSSFSLLLHPLHPAVQFPLQEERTVKKCQKCTAVMTELTSTKQSLFQYRCNFCHHISHGDFASAGYVNSSYFDQNIVQNSQKTHKWPSKNVLFLLEANQYIYVKQIVSSIFQCLRALSSTSNLKLKKYQSLQTSQQQPQQIRQEQTETQDPNLNIGFMFFDTSRDYLLNMQTNQLVIVDPSDFYSSSLPQHKKYTQLFPLSENELFQPLNTINLDEVQEIVEEVMFSAFQNKSSCFLQTVKILSCLSKLWKFESKVFVYSYDKGMIQSPINDAKSNKKSTHEAKQQKLEISSRVQLFILNSSLHRHMVNMGLGANIFKTFECQKTTSADIYYSIFHNLTQQIEYDVELKIINSYLIACNRKQLTIPVLSSNTPIILDFSIPNNFTKGQFSSLKAQEQIENQCIQIIIKMQNRRRVITYKVPKISSNAVKEPYLLNDETFFYIMLCKMISDKSIKDLRNAIKTKCQQIVHRIADLNQAQFFMPKNLINFFMYAFMILQHPICQKKNLGFLYQKDFYLKQGLQTIVKKIYPKVYDFCPQLKPLKFKSKSFVHDKIRIVDNGTFIGLVIGEEVSSQVLKKIFDVHDIDDALQYKQVPGLNNYLNKKMHEAIQLLRQLNELYFLPLKVMKFDSYQFQQTYGNFLYIEQDHQRFFQNCLKS